MISGQANFVLPKYSNADYIKVAEGDQLGMIDIVGSCSNSKQVKDDWINYKHFLNHQFTVMAFNQVEMMMLSINDLHKMELEFPDYYTDFFEQSMTSLRKTLMFRFHAMKECRIMYMQKKRDSGIPLESQITGITDPKIEERRLSGHDLSQKIYNLKTVSLHQIDEMSLDHEFSIESSLFRSS